MKKRYEEANIEIIEWKNEDIIVTSGGLSDSGDINIGDGTETDDTISGGGLKP